MLYIFRVCQVIQLLFATRCKRGRKYEDQEMKPDGAASYVTESNQCQGILTMFSLLEAQEVESEKEEATASKKKNAKNQQTARKVESKYNKANPHNANTFKTIPFTSVR